MSETNAPIGVSAEKHAQALAENRELSTRLAALERQIEDGKKNNASAKLEKQIRDLTKRAETAEARAGQLESSAKRAFTLRHLGGLHNPGAVNLPSVELADDGNGLAEASIAALDSFKADNAWAFKAAEPAKETAPESKSAAERKTPGHIGGSATKADRATDETLNTLQRGGVSLDGLKNAPAGVLSSLGLKAVN